MEPIPPHNLSLCLLKFPDIVKPNSNVCSFMIISTMKCFLNRLPYMFQYNFPKASCKRWAQNKKMSTTLAIWVQKICEQEEDYNQGWWMIPKTTTIVSKAFHSILKSLVSENHLHFSLTFSNKVLSKSQLFPQFSPHNMKGFKKLRWFNLQRRSI